MTATLPIEHPDTLKLCCKAAGSRLGIRSWQLMRVAYYGGVEVEWISKQWKMAPARQALQPQLAQMRILRLGGHPPPEGIIRTSRDLPEQARTSRRRG